MWLVTAACYLIIAVAALVIAALLIIILRPSLPLSTQWPPDLCQPTPAAKQTKAQ